MAKQFETDITISGKLDPSLQKVTSLTQKESLRLQKSITETNKLFAKANLAANGLPPSLKKGSDAMAEMSRKANALQDSMKRVGEIAAGVFAGEAFLGALERGLDIVKEMGATIKEFGISSLDVRAKREVLQNQQRSMLESLGRGGMFGDLDMMLRNMEGRETIIKYSQLMAATKSARELCARKIQQR